MKKLIYIGLSIIIMLTSIIFTGCDDEKKYSLSLSGPAINNGEISLVLGEDSEELIVTINNFSDNISEKLSFDFYENIAKIKSQRYLGNGKTSVTISPAITGATTLRISSYQGSFFTEVPVKVTDKLESISLKADNVVYAVKGDKLYIKNNTDIAKSFILSSENFEFYPETIQKELNFYYQRDIANKVFISSNELMVNDSGELVFLTTNDELASYLVGDKFYLYVESKADTTISTIVEVSVIDAFDKDLIRLYKSELGSDQKVDLYDEDSSKHVFPKFIRNSVLKSIQYFKISIPEDVSVRLSSKYNNFACEVVDYINLDGQTYAEFSVQALQIATDTLVIELYRNDYISYTETIECEIQSCEVATGILINDVLNSLSFILYNGRTQATAQNVNLQLFPENAKFNDDINIAINFYLNYGSNDEVKLENTTELKTMMGLLVGEKDIFTNELLVSDLESNLKIWVNNLKTEYSNLTLEFVVTTTIDEIDYVAKNTMNLSVKEGASEFLVKGEYEINKYTGNTILFVEKGQVVNFSDFDVKSPTGVLSEQIYIGNMQFSCDDNSRLVCDIEQVDSEKLAEIKITAKNVGSALWTIKLDSGAELKLEIQVVDLFKEEDFLLYLSSNNPNIVQIDFNGINGSISNFTIKNSDYSELAPQSNKISLSTQIKASASSKEMLARVYSWEAADYNAENVKLFVNENNSGNVIVSVNDLTTDAEQIKLKISKGIIEENSFKLKQSEEIFEYLFEVKYSPAISTFTMLSSRDVVYPKNEIGYHAQIKSLHEAKMDLIVSPEYYTDLIVFNLIKSNIKWSFSQSYMSNYLNYNVKRVIESEYGDFYVYDIEGYGEFNTEELIFTFNGNSSNISPRLYIYAEYQEFNNIYNSYVSIELKSYTKVSQLSFKNSTTDIYIDAVHTEFTLLPILTPLDANDVSFTATYVRDLTNKGTGTVDVIINEDYSKITLKYNGSGGGQGHLLIVPTTSFTGENSYGYFVSVPVSIGDGTKENPLRINTADELLAINTNEGLKKHYIIFGEIDMGYKSFTPMGEFSGSIKGVNNATIKGINISNKLNGNAGLFTRIKTQNRSDISLSNLTFEGIISLDRTSQTNIGLVCGENQSTILNVNTILSNKNTIYYDDTTASNDDVFGLGILAGINRGIIKIETDEMYPSVTTLAITDISSKLSVNKSSNIAQGDKFFVGGVVGINFGDVSFEKSTKIYNNFGFTTNVNIETSFVTGAICGLNRGTIDGVVVTGKLVSENHIGGICGRNNGVINNSITRCFVYSKGDDTAYIGGVAGKNIATITNTTVEAIYDGTFAISDVVNNALITKKFSGITISAEYINHITDNLSGCTNNHCYSYNKDLINVIALDTSGNYKKLDDTLNYSDAKFTDKSSEVNLPSTLESILLFYYQAQEEVTVFENGDKLYNQVILNNYKNIQACPYVELVSDVNYESKNLNVLSIGSNGEFIINGTGVAQIVAKSNLDAIKTSVANVYVTNYIDGYGIFVGSDKNSYPVYSGSQILVFDEKPVTLYTKLYASDYEYQSGVYIKLVEPSSEDVRVIVTLQEEDIVNIDSNKSTIILTADKNNGEVNLISKVYYQAKNVSILINAKNIHSAEDYLISALYSKGIEEIKLNKQGMIIYPSITPTLNVTIKTNDLLKADLTEKDALDFINDININLYDTINTQNKFTIANNVEKNEIVFSHLGNEVIKLTYKASYNKQGLSFENIKFSFDIELVDKSYVSEFAIVVSSKVSGDIVNTFYLKYESQPITSLVANTYTENTDDNTLSYTNYIEPGKTTNHMTLFVNPIYADYDYIDIVNSETNYENNAQVLFTYDNEVQNYSFLSNGIRLYKTDESYHKLKYTISSEAENNSQVILNVKAYKVGVDEPVYSTSKTLVVRQAAEVKIRIADKNTEDIYLAKGNRYILEVNAGKYSLDQVVIYSSDTSMVNIVKQGDLYYADVLASSDIGEVSIYSYGNSMVDGKLIQSQTYELKLNIMNFTVSDDKIKSEFTYFQANVGSETNLIEKMIEGINLEYNPSVSSAKLAVDSFNTEIKNNAEIIVMLYDESSEEYKEFTFSKTVYNHEYFDLYLNNEGEVIFKALKSFSNSLALYKFKLSFKYSYSNGRVTCSKSGALAEIEKSVEIVSRSSMDNPLPIRNLNDLLSMKEGSHYILLSDIELTSNFAPIKTNIASFNGNGYRIILPSYSVSEISDNGESSTVTSISHVGLFETVASGVIIKNVSLYIKGTINVNIEKYSNSTTYVGMIAGINYGSITNCEIVGDQAAGVKVNVIDAYGDLATTSYVGGLVGHNNGYITNSRFVVNLSANANLAGFVGLNSNHIASSYVKNAYIQNSSAGVNTTNKTAGFVVDNTGMIYTSFISGASTNNFYSNSQAYQVVGRQEAAGFVFYNKKSIMDCYSDIPTYAQSNTSGFVGNNTGSIEGCFTTSKLKDNSQASFNFYNVNNGNISRSYYCNEINIDVFEYSGNSVVKGLTKDEFSDSSNFYKFSIAESNEIFKREKIWFYGNSNVEGNAVADKEFNYEGNKYFVSGRPELSSANIEVKTKLDLDYVDIDSVTSEEIYVYKVSAGYLEEGSEFNPFTISSSLELEDIMTTRALRGTDRQYYNFNNFRLINNIVYGKETSSISSMYKIALCGEFEGNCLSISGFSINTNETLLNGGLFAQIGSDKGRASIKNLVISPKYMNMPNVSIVGSLAGTVTNATVINVSVVSSQMLVAKNIVGGVIGRASKNYLLYNINSSVSVSVSNLDSNFDKSILYSVQKSSSVEGVSYAGGVVGVLGNDGSSSLNDNNAALSDSRSYYLSVSSPVTIIGKIIGIISGGVVDNAGLYNSDVEISNEYNLKAYAYGGYVSGHVRGIISNCNVYETKNKERVESFKNEPIVAKAIGGIAGILQDDAEISDCNVNANIVSSKVKTVGGIVGFIYSSSESSEANITSCEVNGKVKGVSAVGGIVGQISDYQLDVNNIYTDSDYKNTVNLGKVEISECKLNEIEVIVDNSNSYTQASNNIGSVGLLIGIYYGTNNNVLINEIVWQEKTKVKSNIYSVDTDIVVYFGSIAGYYTQAFDDNTISAVEYNNFTFGYKFIKTGTPYNFIEMK